MNPEFSKSFTMKKILLFVAAMIAAIHLHAQWEPEVRLTNNPDSSITSDPNARFIAATDDFVHVVWYDKRDGNMEIYYKRSTDGGKSWGPDTRLTIMPGNSSFPCIGVSGTNLHVIWQDDRDGNNEIYYKRSTDGGLSWETDKRLTNDPGMSGKPSMSVSGLLVHVVWRDTRDGNYEIYYKRSTDGGLSWETDKRLTNDNNYSYYPSIAASGSYLHVVWNDTRDGKLEIYYKGSTDQGITWETDKRLTNNPLSSNLPCVAASGSNVYVVWTGWTGVNSSQILFMRSQDNGLNWGIEKMITSDILNSMLPNIHASGPVVNVVWQDYSEMKYYNNYIRSDDEGENWGTGTALSVGGMNSQNTSLTVSGSFIHVIWYDDRDGNYEIYYKRNPTGGFPVGHESKETDNPDQPYKIYPNPVKDLLSIEGVCPRNSILRVSLINIFGKIMKQYDDMFCRNSNNCVLDVSDMQDGIYFLLLDSGSKRLYKKIIIER